MKRLPSPTESPPISSSADALIVAAGRQTLAQLIGKASTFSPTCCQMRFPPWIGNASPPLVVFAVQRVAPVVALSEASTTEAGVVYGAADTANVVLVIAPMNINPP